MINISYLRGLPHRMDPSISVIAHLADNGSTNVMKPYDMCRLVSVLRMTFTSRMSPKGANTSLISCSSQKIAKSPRKSVVFDIMQ